MIYLASPYSHPDASVMQERYVKTLIVTAGLLGDRQWVYSPIVHCHEMSRRLSMPADFEFWRDYNYHMLELADEMLILTLPGWEASKGVWAEALWWYDNHGAEPARISGEPWLQL